MAVRLRSRTAHNGEAMTEAHQKDDLLTPPRTPSHLSFFLIPLPLSLSLSPSLSLALDAQTLKWPTHKVCLI